MRVEGVLFSPQIILTADGWMDPLPYEEEVLLYAQCSTHASTTRHEFQPVHVLKRSPKEGWALLQSDAPISCAQQSSLPSLNVSELYEGQQLLSMEPPPKRMTSLLVSGRGTGVLAYFQLVTGSLSIGSPLFDTQGKFVTLSAGFTRSTLDSLIGPHWTPVLPKEAIEHALREAKLLIRSHRQ